MSLTEAIGFAVAGREVPEPVLEAAFAEIMDGKATPVGIAALLVALRAKGETAREIVTAARVLRERAVTVSGIDAATVDVCGTGGDGAGTFNISTTAAFVVAGAGVPVAKHGNRGASSPTGSIDVLEALGVRVDLSVEVAAGILAEIGIAPFFARRAHPAMRHVAPLRQELGIRTLMKSHGPLLNPVGVQLQLVGVYDEALVPVLARALGELGARRALVVHGSDGLDEVTTTGTTTAALFARGTVKELRLDPGSLGVPPPVAGALRGGDAAENAAITRAVLDGEAGARSDIVLVNAAAALWAAGAAEDLGEGLALARESVDSGSARRKLEQLARATTEAAGAP